MCEVGLVWNTCLTNITFPYFFEYAVQSGPQTELSVSGINFPDTD